MRTTNFVLAAGLLAVAFTGPVSAGTILDDVDTSLEDISLLSAGHEFDPSANTFKVTTDRFTSVTLRDSAGNTVGTDPSPPSQTFIVANFQNAGSMLAAVPGFVSVESTTLGLFFADLVLAGFAETGSGEIQFIADVDQSQLTGDFLTTFMGIAQVAIQITNSSPSAIPSGADLFGESASGFSAAGGTMVDIKAIVPADVPSPWIGLLILAGLGGLAYRRIRRLG